MDLESLPIRICLIDKQLNIINCTLNFANWLGYSSCEEVRSLESIGAITLQPTLIMTKVNSGFTTPRECFGLVFVSKKGDNIECNVEISQNSSGLVFMNITDVNLVTEVKLDPNNTFSEFISLAEYIPNLIIQVDLNFEIIYANESAERVFEEMSYGHNLSTIFPNENSFHKIRAKLISSLDNPIVLSSYSPEISLGSKNFEISVFPNFDLGNAINSFTLFFSDITDKVENKKISSDNESLKSEITLKDRELRIYQNELEQQINALNEIALVAQLDARFNIIDTNDFYFQFLGYSKENTNIRSIYKQIILSNSFDLRKLKNGEIWKGEISIFNASNKKKTLFTTIIPFFNLTHEVKSYYSISFDITTSKKLQTSLSQALIKEKELSRMKTRFLSTASHQIRTPLAVIQANSELIRLILKKQKIERQETIDQAIARITTEIGTMTDLINDVLSYEGASSRINKPYFEKVNLTEILNYLITQYSYIDRNKNRILFETTGRPVILMLDKKMILNALSNLLSNALKYSEDEVTVKLNFKKHNTLIIISDKGIGIPEEELESLFQPFFRGNASINYEGTGLGLSIAKEYIEINKGKISIQTKENQGTEFTISLPNEI